MAWKNAALVGILSWGGLALPAQPVPKHTPLLIAGRVVSQGQEIPGARVHVLWLAHPELPGTLARVLGPPTRKLRSKTKARGRFRIGLPHRGNYAVYAEFEKRRSAFLFPVSPGDFVELELHPVHWVEGTVTENGQPVADAAVSWTRFSETLGWLERYRRLTPEDTVKSDPNGRYRIAAWARPKIGTSGPRSLLAHKGTRYSANRFYRVDGQHLGQFDLRLSESTNCIGTVLGSDGKPLAGAQILEPVSGKHTRSDALGKFDLGNTFGRRVLVHAEGLDRFWANSAGGRVHLSPGLRLRMRLVRDGAPLANRQVLLASPVGVRPGHMPFLVRSNADGWVTVGGLSPRAPLSAFVAVGGRFVQVLSRISKEPLLLGDVPVVDRVITGQVLGIEKQPLPRAQVMLQPVLPVAEAAISQGRHTILPKVAYTDRAGRFRFEGVLAGPLQICATAGAEGYVEQAIAASYGSNKDGQAPLQLRVQAGTIVTGRVVLPDGKPAVNAQVQHIVTGKSFFGFPSVYFHGRTDGQGRYRFRGLPKHSSFTSYAMHAQDGKGFWSMQTAAEKPLVLHTLAPHPGPFR